MQDANWAKHKKHVFILSSAGKPIFSRYGDESELAGFMGVLQAIISHSENNNDQMRAIIAGKHKVVFVIKGPIYLVMVAQTNEPIHSMMQELTYIHAQILSILTKGVNKIFEKRAQFDLRNLLSGTEKYLDRLTSLMDHDLSIVMNAVHCLRLNSKLRNDIASIMLKKNSPNLLYTILLARHQLVNMARPKKYLLQPADLHLIVNFVTGSNSFRTTEIWTPICLPLFSDEGYLHCYVTYVAEDICLLMISSTTENFYDLVEYKNAFVKEMEEGDRFKVIQKALEHQYYSVSEVGIPGLLHFIYKSQITSQMTAPSFDAPYNERHQRKRLFRLYQYIHHKCNFWEYQGDMVTGTTSLAGGLGGAAIGSGGVGASSVPAPQLTSTPSTVSTSSPHKVYYHTGGSETVLAWVTSGFQLYATFGPLETKPVAIQAANQLLRWIKQEEARLFILNSPVFS